MFMHRQPFLQAQKSIFSTMWQYPGWNTFVKYCRLEFSLLKVGNVLKKRMDICFHIQNVVRFINLSDFSLYIFKSLVKLKPVFSEGILLSVLD